jgi:hypothetical protein
MNATPSDTLPPDDSEAPEAAAPAEDHAVPDATEASAAPPAPAKIDFERAEFEEPKGDDIECGVCHRTIRTEYWQIGGSKILCENCRKMVEETAARANGGAAFGKAFLYGGGAALLCGTGYAIFVAVSDFQFALVTIGIGWAVGTAIQKVTRGFGGRKYQILAVALTYFATTMSYAPALVTELMSRAHQHTPSGSAAPGATGAPAPPPANVPAPENAPVAPDAPDTAAPASRMNPGVAILVVVAVIVAFMLAAPVLSLGSGGISGLLGLLIIFFGLRMAWRISKGITPTITGPHQVDASDAA